MGIAHLRRPIAAAAAAAGSRATATATTSITTRHMTTAIPSAPAGGMRSITDALAAIRLGAVAIGAANRAVEGRRHATVKAQGAYKLRDSSTIPKKLGAKKTGDSYVIPGNIIYKQRGTKWHPGENVGMGRDHTLFSMISGYVKYYRDPAANPNRPDRQYIGVTFEKGDTLPYPRHAMRKRRLNMTATPMKPASTLPAMSASGIPNVVVRKGTGRKPNPRDERHIKLRHDGSYAYREDNWRLGTLIRTEKRKTGSRRVAMRHRRRRTRAIGLEMRQEREDKIARRKEAFDAARASRKRKLRAYFERRRAESVHQLASNPKGAEGGTTVPPPPKSPAQNPPPKK